MSCTDDKEVIKWSLLEKDKHSSYINEDGEVRAIIVTKNN